MTEIGQIKQDKAIFHTVRMSSRGMGRLRRLDSSQRGDALTATYYDQSEQRDNRVKTPLRSQEDY